MLSMWRKTVLLARMVKIEHSIFALPFAYLGMTWAAGGWPGWEIFLALTVAMVAVRSFAMAVNRLADLPFDMKNPRTQTRPLVTGELNVFETLVFIAVSALVFVGACWQLNSLCLALSPLALVWSAMYSYTKRFTSLCHFFLGTVLGLAPLAGWLAVSPEIALAPVLLALGVTFWVGGFDILYACQDAEFDQNEGLHSLPAGKGVPIALALSTFSHVVTALFFLLAGWAAGAGIVYTGFCLAVAAILLFEHRLISADDLSRVNLAFFTLNGFIAVFLFAGAVIDTALR
ncbi:putative 4-hydroxybenzoate polyprenyltransferase [Desulfomicrobium sp. ZS1]|uniref:UbiA-like polyprenyltransferase n=1 Tax=Desulfomicrobium sp. ZS1 TaxID=2952228 RepID=UPI0020B1C60D|nr:UbiA-like polyprenyltransferase [Desulfomicrobium sp. ZS1]UTF50184.1 putative 4-hydroxybenzoate polyprenyltransferase [Desulfomicrobium sp. ZS1]